MLLGKFEYIHVLGVYSCSKLKFWLFLAILGLFDPATGMGFERKDEDFGQTLGVLGIKPGIFIVLPILGPSTIRDAIGIGVDQFFDPIQYATVNTDSSWIMTSRTGVRGVDARANNLKTLEQSSQKDMIFDDFLYNSV